MTGLLKEAVAVWTHLPGTPFTLPGKYSPQERLPGMSGWADREAIERVSKMLEQNKSLDEISASERGEGLLSSLGFGAGGGATAGGMLGRLISGKDAMSPLRNILSKGVSRGSLSGLKNLPGVMKALPLLGAGAGLLAGGAHWGAGKQQRGETAKDIGRGLLAEKVLQRGALREAVQTKQPYNAPLLRGVPILSASATAPYVAIPGSTGV